MRHTHDLKTAVGVNLSDVSGAEPSLALVVGEEVLVFALLVFALLVFALLPVVTHGDVGPANQDLASGVGLVSAGVAT